jgi:predicted ATP-grasp superfamily ATP-dependent carboligase
MADAPAVLIAAMSGRALAEAANRSGYAALVADCFGDLDTVAAARAHIQLTPKPGGIDGDELIAALETLAAGQQPAGAVYGTGLEDRPALIERIARRWNLLGNPADVVSALKDPVRFAALCRACAIPHPEIALEPPADAAGWLKKRRGGSGGVHVRSAADPGGSAAVYFQRRVEGDPVSALFLAAGKRATILGLSRQWPQPAPDQPFRYGGAARPAAISVDHAAAIADAVRRLAASADLVGLNSADFLVGANDFWLLEVNPRPGATLDIFEPHGTSLFALHLAACRGDLAVAEPELSDAAASAIVYAHRDIPTMPALAWPAWAADRQSPGSRVSAGQPLCTVRAVAATAEEARALALGRQATILATIDAELP